MKPMALLLAIATLCTGLSGCSSNPGVASLGADQYMISRQAATGFSGHEQENFNQSINRTKGEIIDFNSKLAESKNIESANRKMYLEADSNCKSLLKLKQNKRSEHLKTEEKKEETELENIIGARFVFNKTSY